MSFGLPSFSKPTPQAINNIVHGASAVFAILSVTISQDSHIPELFKSEFALWGGSLVAIMQALRPFFGVNVDAATVPTGEVSAIKSQDVPKPYSAPNDSTINK